MFLKISMYTVCMHINIGASIPQVSFFCFSQIGVHNGWCYVHTLYLLYLQRGFPQAGHHVSSINHQTLVLRGSRANRISQ